MVLALDLDAFLGLDRLMQAVRPAPAGHFAPGELIDDDDFAVFDDVLDVAVIKRVGAKRLVDVVNRFHVLRVVHVAEPQQFFGLADAFFGQRGGLVFFIDGVVDILNQFRNDLVDAVVLVGGFLGRPGDNQRRAGFVDQDGVHLIDDRKVVAALDAIGQVVLHVVAEIVEAEFVVRAVGNVRAIGRAPSRHRSDRGR